MDERGVIPDPLLRIGIRGLLRERIGEIKPDDIEQSNALASNLLEQMQNAAIASCTAQANDQHYEVPAQFFEHSLGSNLKYSCGFWPQEGIDLDQSEQLALIETCQHARIQNGMDILELGCGWGSLTLHMALHYPDSAIVAVSNSHSQAQHIQARAKALGLSNIEVRTADMNLFDPSAKFDRIVSVEMFEHMRNWGSLFERVATWLKDDGKFFMHVFAHRNTPYFFEDQGPSDWMSRHFFSGGLMPSADLPLRFKSTMHFEKRWFWDGRHYQKTANAWLQKMDEHKASIFPLFEQTYGQEQANTWWNRWRLFHMACAELFGFNNGQEWFVVHYLFSKSSLADSHQSLPA